MVDAVKIYCDSVLRLVVAFVCSYGPPDLVMDDVTECSTTMLRLVATFPAIDGPPDLVMDNVDAVNASMLRLVCLAFAVYFPPYISNGCRMTDLRFLNRANIANYDVAGLLFPLLMGLRLQGACLLR